MNRKFKRFLSAILAVIMVLSAVPVMSYATDSDDYCSYKVGDIIEFGSYPQSLVSDEETLEVLYALEDDWVNADWFIPSDYFMWNGQKYCGKYIDVIFESEKYRAVTMDDGVIINFFKFEPIKWRVLDPDTGLLMSEHSLDAEVFHADTYFDKIGYTGYIDPELTEFVTYEKSTIRNWLNNVFDKTAFTEDEYKIIVDRVIDDTRLDKSYIPTIDELFNKDYGFINHRSADPARVAYPSDYACIVYSGTIWWKNSCGNPWSWMINEHMENHQGCALCTADGKLPTYACGGYRTLAFIRPFIQISNLRTNKKHTPGEWTIKKEATYTENGKLCKYCKNCDELLESKVIPKLNTGLKSIELFYDVLEIQHKNSATLKPTVDCEQDYTLNYSSSDEEVLTVDESGKITTHSRGTATVTCTATDEDGKTLTDTCEVTVKYNFWQWIVRIFLFIIGVNSRI